MTIGPDPPPAGIDCDCGHVITHDGVCNCPPFCATCTVEDCCGQAWSNAHAAKEAP